MDHSHRARQGPGDEENADEALRFGRVFATWHRLIYSTTRERATQYADT